jgi:hypothetical protein
VKAITAILSGAFAGAVVLQGYFAIWRPSSCGRFAEFPVILIYAVPMVAVVFLILIVPSFMWLRRKSRSVSWIVGAVAGMLVGGLLGLTSYDSTPSHLPVSLAYNLAYSISGAVAVGLYARLLFKRAA